jgi:hypothetical protein
MFPAGGGNNTIDMVASGALSNGDKVILQSDGTVKVVTETTTSFSEGFGSANLFNSSSGETRESATCFDSNSNKVVIAYWDQGYSYGGKVIVGTVSGTSISFGSVVSLSPYVFGGTMSAVFDSNSNKVVIAFRGSGGYGTAIVGTVSGTSISFGSGVVFNSGNTQSTASCFDSNSNKVVIAYQDHGNSGRCTAIVGTVSGTSISFGSEVTFNSGNTYNNTQAIASTFDSNSNKVVITYVDGTASHYGKSVVGTVSGTSISFGTWVLLNSGTTWRISSTFDSNSNKVVIAYVASVPSGGRGEAIVGTVSGTSISFGSVVVFNSQQTQHNSVTFDSLFNKIVIAYKETPLNTIGTAIVGTVSGTSISFGSEIVFSNTSAPAETAWPSAVFDSNSNKVVISYHINEHPSYYTKGIVFQNAGIEITTNLTSTNFIGTSEGAFADTATSTVMLRGGITTTQSGLTIGSKYYVQTDGTLSTTPDSPSVVAGQSISATTLLIAGET